MTQFAFEGVEMGIEGEREFNFNFIVFKIFIIHILINFDTKIPFTPVFNRKVNKIDGMTICPNETKVKGPREPFWKLRYSNANRV